MHPNEGIFRISAQGLVELHYVVETTLRGDVQLFVREHRLQITGSNLPLSCNGFTELLC